MKKNVGNFDSRIRTRLGMILVIVGILGLANLLTLGTVASIVLMIVGLISFWTGQTRKCTVYDIANIDTLEEENQGEKSGNNG